jgi:hypothetical protein
MEAKTPKSDKQVADKTDEKNHIVTISNAARDPLECQVHEG